MKIYEKRPNDPDYPGWLVGRVGDNGHFDVNWIIDEELDADNLCSTLNKLQYQVGILQGLIDEAIVNLQEMREALSTKGDQNE